MIYVEITEDSFIDAMNLAHKLRDMDLARMD
ncbi:hypothetical protein BSPWISOXPB_4355 [uncultured Gammaproteobacteria bacterium]|nr:hypothetical protein BSPWISOXPB_4355 [uncultured Gammaproteobacteria bacterium]